MLSLLLDRPERHLEAAVAEALKGPLLWLAAQYLLSANVAAKGSGAREALGRVARFPLSNGARIERLSWVGDTLPSGLLQWAGKLLNYRYRLGGIEANHEAHRCGGRIGALSPSAPGARAPYAALPMRGLGGPRRPPIRSSGPTAFSSAGMTSVPKRSSERITRAWDIPPGWT